MGRTDGQAIDALLWTGLKVLVLIVLFFFAGATLVSAGGLKAMKQRPTINNQYFRGGIADECVEQYAPAAMQYLEDFRAAAAAHRIDGNLLLAIAQNESGFNPRAESYAGAFGIMQTVPGTYRAHRRSTDPELVEDVDTETRMVEFTMKDDTKKLFPQEFVKGGPDKFPPVEAQIFTGAGALKAASTAANGNLLNTIAAYNAGIGAVRKAGGVPNIAETKAYVERVRASYKALRDCSSKVKKRQDNERRQQGGSTTGETEVVGDTRYTPTAATLVRWVQANQVQACQATNTSGNNCAKSVQAALEAAFPGSSGRGGPWIREFKKGDQDKAPDTQDLADATRILENSQLPVWHIRGSSSGQHWIVIVKVDGTTLHYYDPAIGSIERSPTTLSGGQYSFYFGVTDQQHVASDGASDQSAFKRGYIFTPPAR